jgi:hypothetical protein
MQGKARQGKASMQVRLCPRAYMQAGTESGECDTEQEGFCMSELTAMYAESRAYVQEDMAEHVNDSLGSSCTVVHYVLIMFLGIYGIP